MTVKVDSETMTLKVMDCDPFEGYVLSSTHDKTIDVVLVDATTPEEYAADLAHAEEVQKKLTEAIHIDETITQTEEKND